MLNRFWDLFTGINKQGPQGQPTVIPYDYTKLYQALYDLYNNDDDIADGDTTRRLRTVVNRSVEFYASKMLPGAEIKVAIKEDKPEDLKTSIEQIIKSSNFGNNKEAMLTGFSLYGDSFLRVRGDPEHSYIEDISPFYVTDFGENSRGFLTFIRIDIPILDENDRPALYTEYWDDETKIYRSWVTHQSVTTTIDKLGTPQETLIFAQLGIDFIPIVHTKFRDNGDMRGLSCVYHALDKIYEANRIATRLHDLLFAFGEPIFVASANDKDSAGRPLPAPAIQNVPANTGALGGAIEAVKVLFGRFVRLPGVATLMSLIPDIDYSDALAILNAQMSEIEEDLPELRWYKLSATERATSSGTALRTLLGAAIDRANKARNNFLSSLSRAMEMALTIGIYNNQFPASLGNFDSGDFEHELIVDDSWGESTAEKADTMGKLTQAGTPAKSAMKLAGFSDEQVAEAFPIAPTPPEGTQNPTARQNLPSNLNAMTKAMQNVVRVR